MTGSSIFYVCLIFLLIKLGPAGLIYANILNVFLRICLNGFFTIKLLKKEEIQIIKSLLFPDSKVIATFIVVISGGLYMKLWFEYEYQQTTPIIEIAMNKFFLSIIFFGTLILGIILWENKALVWQIIKRKTD